ncbi:MAG: L-ribulose-5-phosphate 4-epimerase [Thermoguttaceae bacterium]|jgi:L-ribulose-5-phosphate 4-epimerase
MKMTQLREEVCYVNKMLPATGLVTMHSGNASGLDRESGRLVIKPSGIDYDRLTPDDLVEVDLASGEAVNAKLRPSVDLPHHLFLYRNMPGVCGIIHTHSNYATAFAALGRPIPLCLTAIADQFGDQIPCTPYVDNEADHIGQMILKCRNRSPAVLLQNHGVFAWGKTACEALKVAVMTEDVAKTVHLALQLGPPCEIPTDEAKKWYDRYRFGYGQHS